MLVDAPDRPAMMSVERTENIRPIMKQTLMTSVDWPSARSLAKERSATMTDARMMFCQ